MKTYQNDTYGELTEAEHQALRQASHPCIRCGMLADVDPVLHRARYGHRPAYRDEQGTWEFYPKTMTWSLWEPEANHCGRHAPGTCSGYGTECSPKRTSEEIRAYDHWRGITGPG